MGLRPEEYDRRVLDYLQRRALVERLARQVGVTIEDPPLRLLASDIGIAVPTLMRALDRLEGRGLVVSDAMGQQGTRRRRVRLKGEP